MIGIIGALDEEIRLFKQDMVIRAAATIAKCEYISGTLNGQEIVITRCGMGKVNAASCASIMIEYFKPEIILNTGVGGSLNRQLKLFDVTIAKDIVQHDYDLVPLGYQRGQVDLFETPFFLCDDCINQAIQRSAKKLNYPSYLVRFATGDKFVDTPEDKEALSAAFHASVCDMESGAIAQVCALHGVRFTSIRTISDTVAIENANLEFSKFLHLTASQAVGIIEDVLQHREDIG